MKAKIRVQAPSEDSVILEVGNAAKTVGRNEDCTVVIKDGHSSGKHCRLFIFSGVMHVEDAGSKNGTYLNNTRLSDKTPFYIGDVVRIGSTNITIAADKMTKEEVDYFTFSGGTTDRIKSSMQVEEEHTLVTNNPLSALKNASTARPTKHVKAKQRRDPESTALIQRKFKGKDTLSKVIDLFLTLGVLAIGTSIGTSIYSKFPAAIGIVVAGVFIFVNKKRDYTYGETLSGMKKIFEDRR